ncbi:MAG TPA: hypothetical protein DCY56_08285 [Candidatus Omnitrophica bacterium]|nr:hypothetical protein [Candidatus Omnitrophota bacterium]
MRFCSAKRQKISQQDRDIVSSQKSEILARENFAFLREALSWLGLWPYRVFGAVIGQRRTNGH